MEYSKVAHRDTVLLTVSDPEKDTAALDRAAAILKNGGLVALPTETVYGLGANALDPQAVKNIFLAKGRPQDNPLIIHIVDPQQAQLYAKDIPPVYYELCRRFSPGPLTVILPKREIIPMETSGGLETVAIRIPSHPVAREIIRRAGVPVAAPSANLSGSPSPTTAEHCVHDLWGRVDAIVDAGECSVGVESTVISLAAKPPLLLRPGAVTPAQLREFLPDLVVHHAVTDKLQENERADSPGMKYKHYAPKAQITILDAGSEQFVRYVNAHAHEGLYALCFEEDAAGLKVPYISLGRDEKDQAKHLFAALRELDEKGAKEVYARCPSRQGVGLAVYNRLIRAAAFHECDLNEETQAPSDQNSEAGVPAAGTSFEKRKA